MAAAHITSPQLRGENAHHAAVNERSAKVKRLVTSVFVALAVLALPTMPVPVWATSAAARVGPQAVVAGPSFQGVDDQGVGQNVDTSDSTGAIGPNSYIEMVQSKIAIYSRAGALIASATNDALTGSSGVLISPQVLWDPATNRFYYVTIDRGNNLFEIGFSKTADPAVIPGDFCNYKVSYGYAGAFQTLLDSARLGDTQHSLLIGVNVENLLAGDPFSSDVDWMTKPAGTGAITTCPAQSTFRSGKVTNLASATITTPTPAQQTDPSTTGSILAVPKESANPRSTLDLFQVTESAAGTPRVPTRPTTTIAVAQYIQAPPAPQPTPATNPGLYTTDARLPRAISGFDPVQNAMAVWTAHTIAGGAGAEVRWYEIGVPGGRILQSGVVADSSLWVFNPAIAPDRAVTGAGAAFGGDMVMTVNTSSLTSVLAIQVVSKVGGGTQSGLTLVQTSPAPEQGMECYTPLSSPPFPKAWCDWGDYAGASPDPAADPAGTEGAVWLTSALSKGLPPSTTLSDWTTWNWAAIP
jgi:hypothetical protein